MACEDFPCCGHTDADPCERQWYDEPDAFDTSKHPHALCDHENGECSVYEYEDDADPETCEHGDTTHDWKGATRCDLCWEWLTMVTEVSPLAYPSKVVPGLWVEIPVLRWHWEVAA
jgi:hypothetical protein